MFKAVYFDFSVTCEYSHVESLYYFFTLLVLCIFMTYSTSCCGLWNV